MKKNTGFRKFTDDIRKIYRVHGDLSDKIFYETTYVNYEGSLSKFSAIMKDDKITLEIKKYSYLPPADKALLFYRVAAMFETNTYYNAFLKINFNNELQARSFFTKILSFIKQIHLDSP
ncbi:MAG: hypothetical protein ABI855_10390 [Bacteroidota bacterium]